jgi:hypothetical protein
VIVLIDAWSERLRACVYGTRPYHTEVFPPTISFRERHPPRNVAVVLAASCRNRIPFLQRPTYLTITLGSQVMIPGNAMNRSSASTMSRMYGITPRMIVVVLMP